MKEYLIKSIQIIRSNILFLVFFPVLLVFMGVLSRFSTTPSVRSLSVTLFLLSMCILSAILVLLFIPIIYGHFIEIVKGESCQSLVYIYKQHWFNCYAVSLVFGGLGMVFFTFLKILSEKISLPSASIALISFIFRFIISTVAIYVFPLVFLKRKSFIVIPMGIKYFFYNFKKSLPLLSLVVLNILTTALYTSFLFPIIVNNLYLTILAHSVLISLNWFIGFVIFLTASMMLINDARVAV